MTNSTDDPGKTAFLDGARAFIASRGSDKTKTAYTTELLGWVKHLDETHPGVKISDVTQEAATSYRDALFGRKLAGGSVRRALAALSGIYQDACAKRRAVWNPFDRRALARPPASDFAKTEPVDRAVAEKLIATCAADTSVAGRRDEAILHLLYETGLRAGTVATVKRADVFFQGDGAILRVVTKGNKEIRVEFPAVGASALKRWLAVAPVSTWVFSRRDGKVPMQATKINKILAARAAEAGVPEPHPHQFRAAYITAALDVAPLNEVQASVGHADPRTTQRYDGKRRGDGVSAAVAKRREQTGSFR